MRRTLTPFVLVLVASCSGGTQDAATPTSAATSGTSAPAAPTARQWLATGQARLTELATAGAALRTLTPGAATNNAAVLTVAEAARQAATAFRGQPPPSTGKAEGDALVASLDALEHSSRLSVGCTSECGAAYATIASDLASFNEALRQMSAVAQTG